MESIWIEEYGNSINSFNIIDITNIIFNVAQEFDEKIYKYILYQQISNMKSLCSFSLLNIMTDTLVLLNIRQTSSTFLKLTEDKYIIIDRYNKDNLSKIYTIAEYDEIFDEKFPIFY